MKIAICAAGTGGHIYPGIAVAEKINKDDREADVLFLCSGREIEKEIFSRQGFKVNVLPSGRGAVGFTASFFASLNILRKFRPDILLSMGGYSSVPAVLAAKLLFVPAVIHEQNVLPGRANRIASFFTKKVAVSFEESRKYFDRKKTVLTGNPVRQEVIGSQKGPSRAKLGISPDMFCVLVVGGSQGSRSLNCSTVEMLRHFKNEKICLVHLSGIKDFEMTKKLSEEAGKKTADYRLLPYMHDIATALAASDLVVSRAGATAISEIALKELASILVPYPYASDDHQTVNARLFFEKGAAAVIPDRQLSGKTLFDEITGLMGDRKKLEKMSENAAQLAVSDAAGKIKGLLYETV